MNLKLYELASSTFYELQMPTTEIQTPQVDGYGSVVSCTLVLVKLHKYKPELVHFFSSFFFLHHVQVLQVMGVDELM